MYRYRNKGRALWQATIGIMIGFFSIYVFVESGFLGDFLAETSAKLVDDDYVHKIGGKSVISDLYYKSLEIARTNEVSSIDSSLKLSVDSMKNKFAGCNLTKTDMINILYSSNSSFKRAFKQNITNAYSNKPQYPNDQDYLSSCHVFVSCFYGTSVYYDSISILKNCGKRANDLYLQNYINYNSISSFDQINFADDLFWNGKIDDADYDILYDIDVIGKLLFQGSKKPSEVLYYQLPDMNFGGNENLIIPYDGTIDWFSPYDPGDFENIGSGNTNSGNNLSGSNSLTNTIYDQDGDGENSLGDDTGIDDEIKSFLESDSNGVFYQGAGINGSVLNGNICITGSTIIGNSGNNIINTGEIIQQYLSGLIQEIKQNKIESQSSLTTGGSNFVSGFVVDLSGDDITDAIEEQVEMLSRIDDQSSQAAIQSCIDKCDGLPFDDKAVCIVKCTCTEFSSPSLNLAGNEALKAGAFKVKFCMIPVQNKGFSKNGKVVYSIEEIYEEVHAILVALRDSGELLVSKKTKEFLETSTSKNKFGKIFSFSISSAFKSIFGESDLSVNKRKEKSFLDNMIQSVLGHGKNLKSKGETNKYIQISDPLYEINKNEIIKSSAFGQNKGLETIVDPSQILQEDRLIKLNSLVFSFLETHNSFWADVEKMMIEINQTAISLKKKGN